MIRLKKPHCRRTRLLLTCVALALVMLVGAAWYFGVTSRNDVIAYVGMSAECHPIWRALALKRIKPGDSIELLLEQHPPSHIEQIGQFQQLTYYRLPGDGLSFTGITLIADEQELVSATAWSCTWEHTFFDSLSDADREEIQNALRRDLVERARQFPE